MIYLAYFILAFSILQLIIAIVNLIFKENVNSLSSINDTVSILIPARNEEKRLPNLLKNLSNISYTNIEILVFNDQSTDGTEGIVMEFMRSDNRIKLINSDGLPPGWVGKNYACYSLAKNANGDYLLFLDADVNVSVNIIGRAVSYLRKYNLSLLSMFPKQIMVTIGEKVTVPIMNYILLSLLPLILVRKSSFASISAANGQFMLFDANVYRKYNPHLYFKDNKVEDIAIARQFKSNKHKISCLVGDDEISCRMYEKFLDAVDGFAKNVFSFFGNSVTLTIFFWMVVTLGFIPVLMSFDIFVFTFYVFIILLTRIIVSIISKQSVLMNLLYLIPQNFTLGFIIYRAFMYKINKRIYRWKEREVL